MAYTIEVHRSTSSDNGGTWTLVGSWTSNGGPFFDMVTDTPGSGTWFYRMRILSNDSADVAGVRRLVLIAGNR